MASKLHNALAKKLPDIQMSEAFINCVFLAMSGGLQDAYTYFTRNEVFSNAQTGNVVLMSTHFMMGEWYQGLKYLLPFLAFGLGVFVRSSAASDVYKRQCYQTSLAAGNITY